MNNVSPDERLFQELKELAAAGDGRTVEISNKAELARKLDIRPQHLNLYLERLIDRRKIRHVYVLTESEIQEREASELKEQISNLNKDLDEVRAEIVALKEKVFSLEQLSVKPTRQKKSTTPL